MLESIVLVENETKSKTLPGFSLAWKDLEYYVYDKRTKSEKKILSQMNGFLKPGSVCAVLGSSGAGKSTFLDVISGRKKASSNVRGQVLVNGHANVSMKHVSRYCTQDDALFGNLTVRETLLYAARFNLNEKMSESERIQVVDDMIEEFGLKGVENTIIGTPLMKGCSGGQVRRVSVASQIIGLKGGIFFLDEPTSGLDSVAAFSVIESVKQLAIQYNSTILATIHQPSSETFNLFTHVLIMSQGSTVYFGPREEAIAHFSSIGRPLPTHANPSDVYLQMTNVDFLEDKEQGRKEVEGLVNAYKTSSYASQVKDEIELELKNSANAVVPQYSYVNGFMHQTSVLMSRALLNAGKNPLSYWIRGI
jgi:ABC-type multidrug transport system ATPase subunit